MKENNFTNDEIRNRLKKVMSEKNISQAELCRRADINKSTLSNFLSGRFGIRQTLLYKIANALDVSVTWLIFGTSPVEPKITRKEMELLETYRGLSPEMRGVADAYFNLWSSHSKGPYETPKTSRIRDGRVEIIDENDFFTVERKGSDTNENRKD